MTTMATKPATKPLAIRSQDCTIDIWESAEHVRIYQDRTIYKSPCRRYENSNSWGLGQRTERFDGPLHRRLLQILEQEHADGEDYTERLFEAISDGQY